MTSVLRLTILLLVLNIVKSDEFRFVPEDYGPLIIDIARHQRATSVFFFYRRSTEAMETSTMVHNWMRGLSRLSYRTMNFYFSDMNLTLPYVWNVKRPLFVAVITDYAAIEELSNASSTYEMSFPSWLVLFVYVGDRSNYCHDPPGNIFHVRFNTRMFVRCTDENIIYEWYAVNEESLQIDDTATWSLEGGIKMLAPSFLYDRRSDLRGTTLKLVVVRDDPFANVNEHGQLNGIYATIFQDLSVILNFNFEIVSVVDEYGRFNPKTGTWSGAVGELYNGRADIAISNFLMTSMRLKAVDYLAPLLYTKSGLYIKEPERIAVKWKSHFLAFNLSLWLAILGVIVVGVISLTYLKVKRGTDRNVKDLLLDSLLEVWGIFCVQALPVFPKKSYLRIAYVSLFLSAMIVLNSYNAAFISFLTLDTHVLPFRSLEEFVKDGSYRLIAVRGTAHYDLYANSEDQLAKKLMMLMLKEDDLPVNILEGFQELCKNPKLALVSTLELRKSVSYAIPCKLTFIYSGRIESSSIILSKKNQFTRLLNHHLQKFLNNGIFRRLRNENITKKLEDPVKYHPVSINSVLTLFMFVAIGIILSIFILIIEKYVFAWRRSEKSSEDRVRSNRNVAIVRKKEKPINILCNTRYESLIFERCSVDAKWLISENWNLSSRLRKAPKPNYSNSTN